MIPEVGPRNIARPTPIHDHAASIRPGGSIAVGLPLAGCGFLGERPGNRLPIEVMATPAPAEAAAYRRGRMMLAHGKIYQAGWIKRDAARSRVGARMVLHQPAGASSR